MPSYDPKRPRPAAAAADEVAPIETILDPSSADAGSREVVEEVPALGELPDVGPVDEVDLRVGPGPGSPEPLLQAGGSEVPVAPAPEENTANRAVLAAVLVGVAALVAVIVVVRRRRG